jgi:NodT family efflux transporter outer membrane factor (OMF) lipoprotein
MRIFHIHFFQFSKKAKLFSFLIIIILLVIVEGCKVKVPPKSEELQKDAFTHFTLPSTWKAGNRNLTDTTNIEENWLSSFNDPDLDSLVSEALKYNLNLRVSGTRIDQATGYVKMSQAALRPAISLLGRGSTKLGDDLGSGLNGALFNASWEIDLWGRLRNARSASQATLLATQADYNFARLSIAAAVARNWYLASETYLESQLASQMVESSTKILSLAKKRHEIGIGTEIDVVVADANLNTMKDGLQQLQLAYSNQLRALEVLAGRYPSAEIQVKNELLQISGTIPAGIPLQTLERRPDLMAAERRFAAAFHRVEEARTAQLPSIKLTASLGAITSQVLQLKPDFSNPFGGGGATLLAPIYQGGSIKASIEIRTAEQKQAVAEYARVALNAIVDVENALDAVQSIDEREKYLLLAVKSNQRALQLEQQSYEIGKTDLRSVSRQQLDLFAAQISLLRIQSEKITQRINLYLALGGNI